MASLTAALLVLMTPPFVAGRQVRGEPKPLRVNSVSEIRASTGDERMRAEFFNLPGRSLLDAGKIVMEAHTGEAIAPPPPGTTVQPETPDDRLRRRVCGVDAVVLGQVVSSRPLLNKSETFLFTDYYVDVKTWIRPSLSDPTAVVSMFGGQVELENRVLTAVAVPPLRSAQRYVLFAKRIPKTSASSYSNVGDPIPVVADRAATGADFTGRESASFTSLELLMKRLREAAASCPQR